MCKQCLYKKCVHKVVIPFKVVYLIVCPIAILSLFSYSHAFSSVGRTLCPVLNQPLHDNSSHLVYADISSPAHINISFSILAEFVANYELT